MATIIPNSLQQAHALYHLFTQVPPNRSSTPSICSPPPFGCKLPCFGVAAHLSPKDGIDMLLVRSCATEKSAAKNVPRRATSTSSLSLPFPISAIINYTCISSTWECRIRERRMHDLTACPTALLGIWLAGSLPCTSRYCTNTGTEDDE